MRKSVKVLFRNRDWIHFFVFETKLSLELYEVARNERCMKPKHWTIIRANKKEDSIEEIITELYGDSPIRLLKSPPKPIDDIKFERFLELGKKNISIRLASEFYGISESSIKWISKAETSRQLIERESIEYFLRDNAFIPKRDAAFV